MSAGIPLEYISRQLGHSTTAVTETHYAKWVPGGGDFYVQPTLLAEGDVPGDLLTRLPESPRSPHTGDPYALPDSLQIPNLQ